MSPIIFCDACQHVHQLFAQEDLSIDSRITLLKLLKISTMIEDDSDDSLTALSIRKYNNATHLQKQYIVRVRCLSTVQDLSNDQERFLYSTMLKIYNVSD